MHITRPSLSLSLPLSSNHLRVFLVRARSSSSEIIVPRHPSRRIPKHMTAGPLFGLVAAGDGEGVEDVGPHDVDHVCRENNPGTAEKSS